MALSEQGNVTIVVKGKDAVGNAFDSVTGKVGKLGKVLATGVIAGTAAAGVAVAGFAAKGVSEFVKFEDSMNEVFTLMPGMSREAMAEMEANVLSASKEMGRLPDEIIPALYQSLSAGVPPGNVFEFLEQSHKTALAGVTDIETAVDALSSVVNAYGSDVISAEKASDILFTTVKGGKTTMGELGADISKITPIAAAVGISFEDVGAALATITSNGVKTNVAATQLTGLFNELSTATGKASVAFKEASGESFVDFIEKGGDVQGALAILSEYAEETGVNMQDMFGNTRAGAAALVLAGSGAEKFAAELDNMANATGSTDEAFETMNSGIARTIEVLKAQFITTLIQVGDALSPLVRTIGDLFVGALESLTPHLETLVAGIEKVSFGVTNFIANVQNGMPVMTALEMAVTSTLVNGFGMAATTVQNLWAQFVGIVSGIQLFIAQVQAAAEPIVAWIQQHIQLQDVLTAFGLVLASVIIPALFSLIAGIVSVAAPIVLLIGAVAALRAAWENDFGGMRTNLTAFWEGTVQPALAQLQVWLSQNIPIALQTLADFWNTVLLPAIEVVVSFITGTLFPVLADLVENAMENVKQMTQDLSTVWETVLLPALTTIYEFITGSVIPILIDLKENAMENVRQMTSDLSDLWNNVFKPALEAVSSFIKESVVPALKQLYEWGGEKVQSALNVTKGVIDSVKGAMDGIKNAIAGVIEKVKSLINWLKQIKVPDIVLPGSPTPFELGLRGISDALQELNQSRLPTFNNQLSRIRMSDRYGGTFDPTGVTPYVQPSGERITNNEYNLYVNSAMNEHSVLSSFELMEAMSL